MQVIIENMPQFQPKLSKHKSFQFVVFHAICVQFFKTLCGKESSKPSNPNKLAMQYVILKRQLQYFTSETLQKIP